MSRRVNEDELGTIDGRTVSLYLEEVGRPRSAEYVRWLAAWAADQGRREQRLRDDYARVLERLHKYEPPEPAYVPRDYTPPAEASD
jgi:hypothetical protein